MSDPGSDPSPQQYPGHNQPGYGPAQKWPTPGFTGVGHFSDVSRLEGYLRIAWTIDSRMTAPTRQVRKLKIQPPP